MDNSSRKPFSAHRIAISAGGSDKELAAHGIGLKDIEDLMVRLSKGLLNSGFPLCFGGSLGIPGQNLTDLLVQATRTQMHEGLAGQVNLSDSSTWPMMNYASWPNYLSIADATRAELVGICQFKDVDPPGVDHRQLTELSGLPNFRDNAEVKRHMADALTAMRLESAKQTAMRIVWGGKIVGAAGWMPGILEEVACSLREQKPVLILGGFGGCAALLAEYLLEPSRDAWPPALSLESCADAARDALLTDEQRRELRAYFQRTQELIQDYHDEIHSRRVTHGLSPELLVEACSTHSASRAMEIALTMAGKLAD